MKLGCISIRHVKSVTHSGLAAYILHVGFRERSNKYVMERRSRVARLAGTGPSILVEISLHATTFILLFL